MKLKTVLIMIGLGYGTLAQGQFGPGLFTGGKAGLTIATSKAESGSTTVDGPKVTTINIHPSIGYFFTEKMAAGLRLGYSKSSSKKGTGSSELKSSTTGLDVELFGRYASSCGSENFGFYTELNFGFASIKGKEELGSVSIDMNPITSFNIGIQPGVMYFPSPKYGFEASLGNIFGVKSVTEKDADNKNNKETSTTMNILDFSTMGLQIGFNYYFNR